MLRGMRHGGVGPGLGQVRGQSFKALRPREVRKTDGNGHLVPPRAEERAAAGRAQLPPLDHGSPTSPPRPGPCGDPAPSLLPLPPPLTLTCHLDRGAPRSPTPWAQLPPGSGRPGGCVRSAGGRGPGPR